MKLSDLNRSVKDLKNTKPLSKENRKKLSDDLANMSDVIEKFKKTGKIETKAEREKVDLLKDFIFSMIKDEDEKRIIRGGWVVGFWGIISVVGDGYYITW